MRLNISKLQQGGELVSLVTPLITQSRTSDPTAGENTSSAVGGASSEKEGSGIELLSKEVINTLMKEGLPGEVDSFISKLKQAEGGGPFNKGYDRNKMYELASMASKITQNANLMKEATSKAYANGGLDAVAVSTTGNMYVRDEKGELSIMSISDFSKKRDKYAALTVNELSKARRFDNRFAFNNEVMTTIQNARGIGEISKKLTDFIKQVGEDTQTSNAYQTRGDYESAYNTGKSALGGKKPTSVERAGLKELSNMYQRMGQDGTFDVTTSTTSKKAHVQEASAYLLSTLSKSEVDALRAQSAVNGYGFGPQELIKLAFSTMSDTSYTSKIDFQKPAAGAGDGSSEGSGKGYNMGVLETLLEGNLNREDLTFTNPEDPKFTMTFKGSTTGQMTGLDNKPMQPNILRKILDNKEQTGIGALIDREHM